jgi:hypothetical protein
VDDDVFAFSPPAGAEVERQTIDPDGSGHGAETDESGTGGAPGAGDEPGAGDDRGNGAEPSRDAVRLEAQRALLDLEQAAALVDFELRAAEGYTARAFRWGYVFDGGLPLDAAGSPLFSGLVGAMGGDAEGDSPTETGAAGSAAAGPAAVLLYGEGFGAIGLAQTRTTPELREQLGELPALFEPLPAGGSGARSLLTPLGGAVVWEQDGVTLVAFGIVPGQDLLEFVGSVR